MAKIKINGIEIEIPENEEVSEVSEVSEVEETLEESSRETYSKAGKSGF